MNKKKIEEQTLTINRLKADLKVLQGENKALKDERKKVKIQVKSLERKNMTLRQEHVNVEKYVSEEKSKMEAWKLNEEKRLKRERRVFERQARAQYQMPNRKDRQEIDALKGTVAKLKLDIQKKDSKHRLNERRLKERNAQLSEKIIELEDE